MSHVLTSRMSDVLTSRGSNLQFHVFTGQLRAMASNSVLVTGKKEAFLVDTLFVKEDATRLVEQIKATGKELTTIVITHAHPDHYFGLPIVQKGFPNAKVYAGPVTVEFQKEFAAKIIHWKEMYPGEVPSLPSELTLPNVLTRDTFTLEGEEIQS